MFSRKQVEVDFYSILNWSLYKYRWHCLILHLSSPFYCAFQHQISSPILLLLLYIICVLSYLTHCLLRHTICLPVHVGWDRLHCNTILIKNVLGPRVHSKISTVCLCHEIYDQYIGLQVNLYMIQRNSGTGGISFLWISLHLCK